MPPSCQPTPPEPQGQTPPTSSSHWESTFPLGCRWYRAILEADRAGFSANMLGIAVLCRANKSILTGPLDIRARNLAITRHGHAVVDSDHMVLMYLLRLYTLWRDICLRQGRPEEMQSWCAQYGLDPDASEEAAQEVSRLTSWLIEGPRITPQYVPQNSSRPLLIVLVKYFFTCLAIECPQADHGRDPRWETVPNREIARIAPVSSVFRLAPQWVLYNSIKHRLGRSEMHIVSAICPEWLLGLSFFRGLDIFGAPAYASRGGFTQRHVRDSLAAASHRVWLAAERRRLIADERQRRGLPPLD